jgi:predicted lipoprotein with Yx(FWY)xxD motif
MKPVLPALACLLGSLTLPLLAAAQAPLKKTDGVLVDANGMTVYTFDKDSVNSGKSTCSGRCAENWPPVPSTEAQPPAPYAIVTREDGSKQLAYKGKPLYTFVKDKKPGDKSGDKAMNAWHAVTD